MWLEKQTVSIGKLLNGTVWLVCLPPGLGCTLFCQCLLILHRWLPTKRAQMQVALPEMQVAPSCEQKTWQLITHAKKQTDVSEYCNNIWPLKPQWSICHSDMPMAQNFHHLLRSSFFFTTYLRTSFPVSPKAVKIIQQIAGSPFCTNAMTVS